MSEYVPACICGRTDVHIHARPGRRWWQILAFPYTVVYRGRVKTVAATLRGARRLARNAHRDSERSKFWEWPTR